MNPSMFSSWRILVHVASGALADNKRQGLIKTDHTGLFDHVDS